MFGFIAMLPILMTPAMPDLTPVPDHMAEIKARLKLRGGIHLGKFRGRWIKIKGNCDLDKLLRGEYR